MIDLLIYGTILILSTSVTSIGIIIAIYYMFTKRRVPSSHTSDGNITLKDQKEI